MPGGTLLDLLPIWTAILALAVFLYVLLDGFDLGVGILYGFAGDERSRTIVMNSIAPIWDGNETWLILGGLGLFAAFPLAFAIIIPAVYFPLLMLLALVFRGVAFEFQFKEPRIRRFWQWGFCIGLGLATFAQGSVLGAFIQGFKLDLNSGSEKRLLLQQLTRMYVALSTTPGAAGTERRRDQAVLVSSRTLGGSAMRAALNSGPTTPVAGVRRVMC